MVFRDVGMCQRNLTLPMQKVSQWFRPFEILGGTNVCHHIQEPALFDFDFLAVHYNC